MVRVGIPEVIDERFLTLFPEQAQMIRLPADLEHDIEIDFWIPPLFPGEVMKMYPHLKGIKVVQGLWAGVDLLLGLLPKDVIVCDARGAHNIATAEWVVTAILAMLKQLPIYGEVQRSGEWRRRAEAGEALLRWRLAPQGLYPTAQVEELAGKRILIVGYGSIGKSIEDRLGPFEVSITRVARSAREGVEPISRFHQLLPHADIVVLIVPLTEETTGLVGARELSLMKHAALLVNAARGPVVDTDALLEALHAGTIRAAIDVTDPEPLPDGHPLWHAPNLLITPHVAGASPQFMERPMALAAEQVRRYIAGEPLKNLVADGY